MPANRRNRCNYCCAVTSLQKKCFVASLNESPYCLVQATKACLVTQHSLGMLQSKSNVFHEEFNSVQSTCPKTWLCPWQSIAFSIDIGIPTTEQWCPCSCSGDIHLIEKVNGITYSYAWKGKLPDVCSTETKCFKCYLQYAIIWF